MKFDDLDAKMRRGEYFHGLRIPDGVWPVLRLDGRSFSKFTAARFEKPFDERFHSLMLKVTTELVRQLGGLYGYTESDEISILLPQAWDMFDREVEKAVSVSASIAASTFTHLLGEAVQFDCRVWFDGRLLEVTEYFAWRQGDCCATWCCER